MEADTSRRSLLRTPAGVVTSITALGVIAYISWVFSGTYRLSADIYVSSLWLISLYACLCILGVYVALQRDYTSALRWAWLIFALGGLSNLCAEGLRFSNQVFSSTAANPNPVYLLSALSYPLTLAGLLFLPLAFVPRQERGILWLDLGLLATFFGMAVWYYFLTAPQFSYADDPGKAWAMAYPVGDFLILAGLVALIQRDLSRAARWIVSLLVMAILFSTSGDLFFAYHELNEISYSPAYLTIFSLGAVQLQLVAAARQIASGAGILSDPPAHFSPLRHIFRLALPYLAVIVGLGLLTVVIHAGDSPDPRLLGVLYGSYILVGFVLLRQYVVLRENVRLYQKMRRVAWTDSLTGVYNRHFFNEMLPREIERAGRYHNQLSILLLDMDGFKEFNDTYGHLQGDTALTEIARIFASQLRSSDTLARFGGDEFVVILPEANRRMARATAERIIKAVNSQSLFGVQLSVSAGIAVYRPELSPAALLEEADQDLYRHKNANGHSQA